MEDEQVGKTGSPIKVMVIAEDKYRDTIEPVIEEARDAGLDVTAEYADKVEDCQTRELRQHQKDGITFMVANKRCINEDALPSARDILIEAVRSRLKNYLLAEKELAADKAEYRDYIKTNQFFARRYADIAKHPLKK